MSDAAAPLRAYLEGVEVRSPTVPVIGNARAAPYPGSAAAIRETLAAQVTSPVRFVESVERLVDEGHEAAVFAIVASGPNSASPHHEPGERVMRPDYGCLLHRLLFLPNDATTHGLAIYYVQRALERWEPRIEILNLDASQHPEAPEILHVHLTYRVKTTQEIERLTVSLNLVGDDL